MEKLAFAPASKEQAKARLALVGPSGSGKTYTALLTGTVLAGEDRRVALVDTERGSASKYADEFTFDTVQLTVFEPVTLVKALAQARESGYDVVIVDSLSHFWSGTDGMLEQVDLAARRLNSKSNFPGWKEVRPMERAMIDALLAYPGHVIVTMRTKTEYVIETDERGRAVPRKVGLKPEQRDGIEYEFDIVADLDHENTLVVSKTRARPLAGEVITRPGQAFARAILDWLTAGKPAPTVNDYVERATSPEATYETLRTVYTEASRRGLMGAAVLDADEQPTTLGELLVVRGNQLKTATATATAAAAAARGGEGA